MQQPEAPVVHLTPQAEDTFTLEDYNDVYVLDSEDGLLVKGDDDRNVKMDDYKSDNDSDVAEDEYADDAPTVRYERNNRGFEYFIDDKGNIELSQGHTLYIIYDFRV